MQKQVLRMYFRYYNDDEALHNRTAMLINNQINNNNINTHAEHTQNRHTYKHILLHKINIDHNNNV